MEGGYAFLRWYDKRGACQTGSQAEGGIGADDQLGAAGAGAFEPGRGRRDAKGGVTRGAMELDHFGHLESAAQSLCHGSAGVSMSGNAQTSAGEFEDPDAEDFLRRGKVGDVVAEQGMVQPVDREIPQQGMVGGIARGERHGFGR